MKNLVIILLLMLSSTICADENAINKALNRLDYHQTLQLLQKEKSSLSNELLKVQCYKNLMLYDKAIAILEKLTETDSVNVTILNGLSDLYQTTGRFYKANNVLNKLLRLQPENKFFVLGYTANIFKMKEWSRTLELIQTNFQTDTIPHLLTMAGDCHWQLEKNDSAIYYYKKAVQKMPDDYSSTIKLARIYLQTKQYQLLTQCTNDYRKIDSCNTTINQYNGIGHCFLNQYDSAIIRLKKLYLDGENSFTTTYYLGSSYYGKQDYYEAVDYLRQAYTVDSTNLNLIFYLGRSTNLIGKFEKGITLLKRGVQLMQPKDTVLLNYYQNIALGYNRWNKPQQEFDYYSDCLKLNPNSKMTVYKMATIMDHKLKNRKLALKYYNQFLSSFNQEPEVKNENTTVEVNTSYYSVVKRRVEELKEEEFFNKN